MVETINDAIIRVLIDFGANINAITYDLMVALLHYPLLHEVIRKYLHSRRSLNPERILDLLLDWRGA